MLGRCGVICADPMAFLLSLQRQWKKHLDDGVKTANSKTTSRAQVVQKWSLLPQEFSEKAGELTPTLKLKRSVVAKKYEAVIDALYPQDKD
jgi:long-subunit acyl-CoA synthetase (AMP-forming)